MCLCGGCASVDTIQEGAAYRATSLNDRDLEQVLRDKQIATVVNLSGFQPAKEWYRQQHTVCRDNKVSLVDVEIDPYGPNREEVIELLNAFELSPKPILLHANHNWEGIGLAAGLYRLAEAKEDKKAARKELPFWAWRQSPVPRFQAHDRFLYEWRDKSEFYATYQVDPAEARKPSRRQRGSADEPKVAIRPPTPETPENAPAVTLGKPF